MAETEKQFQAAVIQAARLLGWMAYHTHDSRRSESGFPDLVLVRERVVFCELKNEKGRATPAQWKWGDALDDAGAEFHLWRPSDWTKIEKALARRKRVAA